MENVLKKQIVLTGQDANDVMNELKSNELSTRKKAFLQSCFHPSARIKKKEKVILV
jgi:hypothetical protein